jgi:hypothetical protein
MMSDDRQIILRVVEHYAHTGQLDDSQVKVTCLPDNKTSFVEQDGSGGRSIMLSEYHMEGRVIWAGYSSRSGIVYLSEARKS